MIQKHYLVTGGAGFIGSALVKRLVRDGHRVRVLDDFSRGANERLAAVAKDIETISGDIRDAATVWRAVAGVDSVCHLAAVNGTEFFYQKPQLVLEVAVKGIVHVIDACLQHGVDELVLTSSSEVYQTPPVVPTDETAPLSVPDPLNPRYSYGGGKIISELMAINYGRTHFRHVIIIRPHNVYGPDMGWEHVVPQFAMRMKELAREGSGPISFPIQGTGQETRSFVFIDDFIDGFMLAMERGEHLGIYHVGTSDEVTIAHVAEQVGRCFGRDVTVVAGAAATGGTPRRCPDITRLTQLGYRPKVSLASGLAPTVRWYAEHSRGREAAVESGSRA